MVRQGSILACLSILLALTSCSLDPALPQRSGGKGGGLGGANSDPKKLSQSNEGADAASGAGPGGGGNSGYVVEKSLEAVDPKEVRVIVGSQPSLMPASEGSSLKVPTFTLATFVDMAQRKPQDADYVQVLRCAKGTKLRTALYSDISEIPPNLPTRLDQLRWAWAEAVANSNSCAYVGTYIARDKVQDFAAKTGSFFYVINPCVHKERSKAKETCSYNLVVTEFINYENTLSAKAFETASALAQAEGEIAGLYSQLYNQARLIRLRQEECENNYAVEQSVRNAWKGLASFLAMGVGAFVGSVMSGGTAALQGAKTGLGIAIGIFGKMSPEPLKCTLVETEIAKAQELTEKLEPAVEKVLELRAKLGELHAGYAKIDEAILKNNAKQ